MLAYAGCWSGLAVPFAVVAVILALAARRPQADERAHLRDLPKCRCGKVATVELFNGRNASFGRFCAGCGRRALARLKRGEGV
jgi:hypothetical protein